MNKQYYYDYKYSKMLQKNADDISSLYAQYGYDSTAINEDDYKICNYSCCKNKYINEILKNYFIDDIITIINQYVKYDSEILDISKYYCEYKKINRLFKFYKNNNCENDSILLNNGRNSFDIEWLFDHEIRFYSIVNGWGGKIILLRVKSFDCMYYLKNGDPATNFLNVLQYNINNCNTNHKICKSCYAKIMATLKTRVKPLI